MTTFSTLPLRKVSRQFRLLMAEIIGYCAAFRTEFESAVEAEINKAQELGSLPARDRERIRPALYDAACCYHSVRVWPIFVKAIEHRSRMQVAIGLAAALVAAYLVSSFPFPFWGQINGNSILISLLAAAVLLLIAAFFHGRTSRLSSTILLSIAAVIFFVAVAQFKKWSSYPQPVWRHLVYVAPLLQPRDRAQLVSQSIAHIMQVTFWLLGYVCIFALAPRYLGFLARVATSPLEPGHSRPGQQSAEVIIGLVHIGYFVNELIKKIEGIENEDQNYPMLNDVLTWRKYPSNAERSELNFMLSNLARLVRRHWMPAMESSYGIAGQWVASYGPRIEFFVSRHRARNALIGNNLLELRDAMSSAMVQAADGNWHLIGATDEFPATRMAARWRRILRRSFGISAPLVAAFLADHFLRSIPSGYLQTIILTCLAFAGVQIIYIIDPESPARLDIAGRVGGLFKQN